MILLPLNLCADFLRSSVEEGRSQGLPILQSEDAQNSVELEPSEINDQGEPEIFVAIFLICSLFGLLYFITKLRGQVTEQEVFV